MFRPISSIDFLWSVLVMGVLVVLAVDASVDRKTVCGSESDCVVVKNENGGVLKLDELDFSVHTVGDILKRLPDWFGKRPAILYRRGKAMSPEDSLEMWQLPVGAELTLNSPTAKGAPTKNAPPPKSKGKGATKSKQQPPQDL